MSKGVKFRYGYENHRSKMMAINVMSEPKRRWYHWRPDWFDFTMFLIVSFFILCLIASVSEESTYKCTEYGPWKTKMMPVVVGKITIIQPRQVRECLVKVRRSHLDE